MWLDGKNDITPETWDELNEILYDIPKTPFNRYRSDFVYRGLANKAWELETSLIRLKGAPNIERPMCSVAFLSLRKLGVCHRITYGSNSLLPNTMVCQLVYWIGQRLQKLPYILLLQKRIIWMRTG